MVSFLWPGRGLFHGWEETSGGFKIMVYFKWERNIEESWFICPNGQISQLQH